MQQQQQKIEQSRSLINYSNLRIILAIVLIILVSLPVFFRQSQVNPIPISHVQKGGNYVLLGNFTYSKMTTMEKGIKAVIYNMAHQYSSYFDANIIGGIPDHRVHTLVILAHGGNNGTHIFLQLNNSRYTKFNSTFNVYASAMNDIPADRVIYISCSIGVIRQLDNDTKHYAYSLQNEPDTYNANVKEYSDGTIKAYDIHGFGQFFLDLIKTGMPWDQAELTARSMVNNMTRDGTF